MTTPAPLIHAESGLSDNGASPEAPLQLPEPDLSYYLALVEQLDAARRAIPILEAALNALAPVITRRMGLEGRDWSIDGEGTITVRETLP